MDLVQESVQKNLPQSSSDFIYAIIVEEYGLIGGLVFLFYIYYCYSDLLLPHKPIYSEN
jgi:cell division protein FtsW (lipid II flippase)